ncbi:anti-sigma factor family protein [Ursidibacter sp. B-7004-1]
MKRCKQITELISLGNEQKLAFNQRCAVNMHLLFCPYCRAFKQNTQQMRQLMQQFKHWKDKDDE